MISPHPGHGSKEVISNNAPSQILQGEGGFLFNQHMELSRLLSCW